MFSNAGSFYGAGRQPQQPVSVLQAEANSLRPSGAPANTSPTRSRPTDAGIVAARVAAAAVASSTAAVPQSNSRNPLLLSPASAALAGSSSKAHAALPIGLSTTSPRSPRTSGMRALAAEQIAHRATAAAAATSPPPPAPLQRALPGRRSSITNQATAAVAAVLGTYIHGEPATTHAGAASASLPDAVSSHAAASIARWRLHAGVATTSKQPRSRAASISSISSMPADETADETAAAAASSSRLPLQSCLAAALQRYGSQVAVDSGVTEPALPADLLWKLVMDTYADSVPLKQAAHTHLTGRVFFAWRAAAQQRRAHKRAYATLVLAHRKARMLTTGRSLLYSWFNLTLASLHYKRVIARKTMGALRAYAELRKRKAQVRQFADVYYSSRLASTAVRRWAAVTSAARADSTRGMLSDVLAWRMRASRAVAIWRHVTALPAGLKRLQRLQATHRSQRALLHWRTIAKEERQAQDAETWYSCKLQQKVWNAWRGVISERKWTAFSEAQVRRMNLLRVFRRLKAYAATRVAVRRTAEAVEAAHCQRLLHGAVTSWRFFLRRGVKLQRLHARVKHRTLRECFDRLQQHAAVHRRLKDCSQLATAASARHQQRRALQSWLAAAKLMRLNRSVDAYARDTAMRRGLFTWYIVTHEARKEQKVEAALTAVVHAHQQRRAVRRWRDWIASQRQQRQVLASVDAWRAAALQRSCLRSWRKALLLRDAAAACADLFRLQQELRGAARVLQAWRTYAARSVVFAQWYTKWAQRQTLRQWRDAAADQKQARKELQLKTLLRWRDAAVAKRAAREQLQRQTLRDWRDAAIERRKARHFMQQRVLRRWQQAVVHFRAQRAAVQKRILQEWLRAASEQRHEREQMARAVQHADRALLTKTLSAWFTFLTAKRASAQMKAWLDTVASTAAKKRAVAQWRVFVEISHAETKAAAEARARWMVCEAVHARNLLTRVMHAWSIAAAESAKQRHLRTVRLLGYLPKSLRGKVSEEEAAVVLGQPLPSQTAPAPAPAPAPAAAPAPAVKVAPVKVPVQPPAAPVPTSAPRPIAVRRHSAARPVQATHRQMQRNQAIQQRHEAAVVPSRRGSTTKAQPQVAPPAIAVAVAAAPSRPAAAVTADPLAAAAMAATQRIQALLQRSIGAVSTLPTASATASSQPSRRASPTAAARSEAEAVAPPPGAFMRRVRHLSGPVSAVSSAMATYTQQPAPSSRSARRTDGAETAAEAGAEALPVSPAEAAPAASVLEPDNTAPYHITNFAQIGVIATATDVAAAADEGTAAPPAPAPGAESLSVSAARRRSFVAVETKAHAHIADAERLIQHLASGTWPLTPSRAGTGTGAGAGGGGLASPPDSAGRPRAVQRTPRSLLATALATPGRSGGILASITAHPQAGVAQGGI